MKLRSKTLASVAVLLIAAATPAISQLNWACLEKNGFGACQTGGYAGCSWCVDQQGCGTGCGDCWPDYPSPIVSGYCVQVC